MIDEFSEVEGTNLSVKASERDGKPGISLLCSDDEGNELEVFLSVAQAERIVDAIQNTKKLRMVIPP
jgi:hypothetical protein